MAIELFRKVSSLTTLRGRTAMYHTRQNRLAKHTVTKSIIFLWDSISFGPGIGFGSATGIGIATGVGVATGNIVTIGSITGTGVATGVGAEV